MLGCLVWYGTLSPAPEAGVPPDDDEILSSPEEFVGQRVLLGGTVVDLDPLTIEITDGSRSARLGVDDVSPSVATGDTLIVYGSLIAENRLVAESVVHKPAGAYTRTLVVSTVAGVWVLVRSLRHWRPDLREGRIVRRGGGE